MGSGLSPRVGLGLLASLWATGACGDTTHRPRNDDAGEHPGASGVGGTAGVAGTPSGVSAGAGGVSADVCGPAPTQAFDTEHMQPYRVAPEVSQAVSLTLAKMTPEQRLTQLLGMPVGNRDFSDIERSPDVEVPDVGTIRGYRYRDGTRGVNLDEGQPGRPSDGNDFSTVFPAASLRAASWDLALEKRVGEAMGDETAASMNNLLLAPIVTLVRHPYWGRTQEAYGEDTYHVGRMAAAFTVGLQRYVSGCAGLFAGYSVERNRSSHNMLMNEQTLREIYGRPFEMVIRDGGIGCVMASTNLLNGVKATQNRHLLRDVLRTPVAQGGFGFEGLVLSDLFAMPGDQELPSFDQAVIDTKQALHAGLDVERAWQLHYTPKTLALADQSLIQQAAQRVLTQKYRFESALVGDPWSPVPPTATLSNSSIATNFEHEALAEQVALESAVLLTNGPAEAPVLPLVSANIIAVLGLARSFEFYGTTAPKSCGATIANRCTFDFGTAAALGDRGSSLVNGDPARVVGPFAGIQAAVATTRLVTSGHSADDASAAHADAVVVVVGNTPGDEGEEFSVLGGGDRSTLDLLDGQNELVESVLDLMLPTVIVIESGSIVNVPWLGHPNQKQATIWAGYPGVRGGTALGKLIFGQANFSGKMPMAWPAQSELDRTPFKDAEFSTSAGYFSGYREYDRRGAAGQAVELVFPFGHGLSYSSFEYSNLGVPCQAVAKDAIVELTVEIENTSTVGGDEIAMLFVKPPPRPAGRQGERPVKELKSFARVSVAAGEKVAARLPLRIADLRRWEGEANGAWVVDSGDYTLLVGRNAEDAETASTRAILTVHAD
jgi:beta-glucosidase